MFFVVVALFLNGICASTGSEIPCKSGNEDTLPRTTYGDNSIPYSNLKTISEEIKASCGKLCFTNDTGVPGKYYNAIWKDIDCTSLFSNTLYDRPSEFFRPPKRIPKFLLHDFTHGGKISVEEIYKDGTKEVLRSIDWSEQLIEDLIIAWREKTFKGFTYFKEDHTAIYKYLTHRMDIKGKHVLVIGTENPWLEALILEAGADKVTTLEYVPITNHHPKLDTITPKEFSKRFLEGTLPSFDAMVTFSSLEHSGLGRYGDQLNPWGDLITMAKAWCVVKPGGLALVGVPTGLDQLVFNLHRMYGPQLFSQLFANWKQVYTEAITGRSFPNSYQPLHIVQKVTSAEELL